MTYLSWICATDYEETIEKLATEKTDKNKQWLNWRANEVLQLHKYWLRNPANGLFSTYQFIMMIPWHFIRRGVWSYIPVSKRLSLPNLWNRIAETPSSVWVNLVFSPTTVGLTPCPDLRASTLFIVNTGQNLGMYFLTYIWKMWKWYFVTKIVLTCCKKTLFYWSRKTFEIRGWRLRICKIFESTGTIYSNRERSELYLVTECFFYLFLAGGSSYLTNYNN